MRSHRRRSTCTKRRSKHWSRGRGWVLRANSSLREKLACFFELSVEYIAIRSGSVNGRVKSVEEGSFSGMNELQLR